MVPALMLRAFNVVRGMVYQDATTDLWIVVLNVRRLADSERVWIFGRTADDAATPTVLDVDFSEALCIVGNTINPDDLDDLDFGVEMANPFMGWTTSALTNRLVEIANHHTAPSPKMRRDRAAIRDVLESRGVSV